MITIWAPFWALGFALEPVPDETEYAKPHQSDDNLSGADKAT